jgi:methionyl-tRNA synthetase
VPGDSGQVVYVWFDALTNYLSGLGSYPPTDAGLDSSSDARGAESAGNYDRWWAGDAERVRVIGKGIVRFHAVYWIAFLCSAGLPTPTRLLVHDYLTVNGSKIAKSGTQAVAPTAVVDEFSSDALRWWLLRDPAQVGTTDFTVERLVAAHNQDLANSIGNLVSRAVSLAQRSFGVAPEPGLGAQVRRAADRLPRRIDEALVRYDFRAACEAIVAVAESGNRLLAAQEPWHLAAAAATGDDGAAARFEAVIGTVLGACRVLADELAPFLPAGATRLAAALAARDRRACFPRITAPAPIC